MGQILVRNIEDHLKARLQARAKRHKRSMEAEVREILRNSLNEEEKPSRGFATETIALFSGRGIYIDEPFEEIRDLRMQIPDFES